MIELYGHPFSAFTWKPLIALHERGVPFTFRTIGPDHPGNAAQLTGLSPTGQFPALVDGAYRLTGSSTLIEHCDRYGEAPPMIPPERDAAIEARMLADVFDDYVAAPMQRIVAEALRPADAPDPFGVAEARGRLDRSYAWLDRRLGDGWAVGERFTAADCAAAPALFYADWAHPIPAALGALRGYRARLLARPSVARVIDEARPFRSWFPLGAPDRD